MKSYQPPDGGWLGCPGPGPGPGAGAGLTGRAVVAPHTLKSR